MLIKIKETNKTHEFELIDPNTGVNWIKDFIGNAGGFVNGDFEVETDEDGSSTGYWLCDQVTFEWWDNILNHDDPCAYIDEIR